MRLLVWLLITQFSVFASPKTIAECTGLSGWAYYSSTMGKKVSKWEKDQVRGKTTLIQNGKIMISLLIILTILLE
jgi:hypothetical protein